MAILKTRKSGFEDTIFVIVIILVLSIFLLVLSKTWTEIRDPIEESITESMPTNTAYNITEVFDGVTTTISVTDKLVPLILIGLFAFLFIGLGAYMQHPIMIFVGIILLAVAVLLGVIFSNVYQEISGSDSFITTDMPISKIYMEHLPTIIVILFIFIIGLLVYFKNKSGGSAQL